MDLDTPISDVCTACNSLGIYQTNRDGKVVVICPNCMSEKDDRYHKVLNWGTTTYLKGKRPGNFQQNYQSPAKKAKEEAPLSKDDLKIILDKLENIYQTSLTHKKEIENKLKAINKRVSDVLEAVGETKDDSV